MNSKTLLGAFLLLAALPFSVAGQQLTSGKIAYDITYQRRPGGNAGQSDNFPKEITRNNVLLFNKTSGKWGPAADNNQKRMRATYLDFQQDVYLRTFEKRGNDTTFFIATPFKEAEAFQLTGKTKQILGYNCQEATTTLRNQPVTLWFTKEIPISFSPLNGLIPPGGGTVLELQSSRIHAVATAVDPAELATQQLAVPQPSQKVSRQEIRHRHPRRRPHNKQRDRKSDKNTSGESSRL